MIGGQRSGLRTIGIALGVMVLVGAIIWGRRQLQSTGDLEQDSETNAKLNDSRKIAADADAKAKGVDQLIQILSLPGVVDPGFLAQFHENLVAIHASFKSMLPSQEPLGFFLDKLKNFEAWTESLGMHQLFFGANGCDEGRVLKQKITAFNPDTESPKALADFQNSLFELKRISEVFMSRLARKNPGIAHLVGLEEAIGKGLEKKGGGKNEDGGKGKRPDEMTPEEINDRRMDEKAAREDEKAGRKKIEAKEKGKGREKFQKEEKQDEEAARGTNHFNVVNSDVGLFEKLEVLKLFHQVLNSVLARGDQTEEMVGELKASAAQRKQIEDVRTGKFEDEHLRVLHHIALSLMQQVNSIQEGLSTQDEAARDAIRQILNDYETYLFASLKGDIQELQINFYQAPPEEKARVQQVRQLTIQLKNAASKGVKASKKIRGTDYYRGSIVPTTDAFSGACEREKESLERMKAELTQLKDSLTPSD